MRERVPGIVAIVLAAGVGARLGGPKALLRVGLGDGVPLVEAQCRDRLEGESTRAIAVVRADVAAVVGDRLRAAGAEVVVSRAADSEGPAGSLAAAVAYLTHRTDYPADREGLDSIAVPGDEPFRAAIVTPVDVRVRASTVRRLAEELLVDVLSELDGGPRVARRTKKARGAPYEEGAPPLAIVPRFQGRRGHPVVLLPEALARYGETAPHGETAPPPLRDHLRSLRDRVAVLDVDDPWTLEDLDFAHQTATLRRFTGGRALAFVS